MKVRLYSDLHREFDGWDAPVLDNEEEYVLVLAGDIGVARKNGSYVPFLAEMAERHKAVVYVSGNHEYYGDSFDRAWGKIKENVGEVDNLHFLNMDTVDIDGVRFIGATLWTDMAGEHPRVMQEAGIYMNDYNAITRLSETDTDDGWTYRGKLKPTHTVSTHYQHKQYIDDQLYQAKQDGMLTFVVTHHGPTWQSVSPKFIGSTLNGAYVSNLTDLIRERAPDIWVHGHSHDSVKYFEGECLVMSNPKGYPAGSWRPVGASPYENEDFREDGLMPELDNLLRERADG